MEAWSDRVFEKGEELEERNDCEEAIFAFSRKASKKDLKAAEGIIGKKLPKRLEDFFLDTNGMSIDWTLYLDQNPSQPIIGKTNIPSLSSFLKKEVESWEGGKEISTSFWSRITKEEEISRYQQYYVLDDIGFGNYVLLVWDNDKNVEELFLYLYRDTIYPLPIDLSEYFRLLEKTRGLYLWQQYLVKDSDFLEKKGIRDQFFENMEILFPEEDLSEFPALDVPSSSSASNLSESSPNYLILWNGIFQEMLNSNDVEEVQFEPNPGVHISVLNKVTCVLGESLPESMVNFYSSMNGFQFSWTYKNKNGEDPFSGQIIMPSLENVFGGEGGVRTKEWDEEAYKDILWHDDMPTEAIQSFYPLKRIELIEGVSMDVLIQFGAKGETPRLLLSDRLDLFSLNVSFEEYLFLLTQTRGFTYWQLHLLSLEEQKELNISLPYLKQMKKIFPEADFHLLK